MIVRAPGKVVLSGAYSVLEGAPAIVSAVDRGVIADGSRPADFLTPEVAASLNGHEAPWFDADELRGGTQKLGLGSSAAILVASLAARLPGIAISEAQRSEIIRTALVGHARAQGGGSGIDVMCSAIGGTIIAWHRAQQRIPEATQLPGEIYFQFFSAGLSASTAKLLASVRALKQSDPNRYENHIGTLRHAAERAATATRESDADALIAALREQGDQLAALGKDANAPIVTPELERLREAFTSHGAIYPAGAGGGDIWLHADRVAPSQEFFDTARTLGQTPVALRLGAPGLSITESAEE